MPAARDRIRIAEEVAATGPGNEQTEGDLAFPVLVFDDFSLGMKHSKDALTVVWASLIRTGWFDGLNIVDSRGWSYEVVKARKVREVGFLWGFNLDWDRRIEVTLTLRRIEPSLERTRSQLLALLKGWRGLELPDDYDGLLAAVHGAGSIRDLVSRLGWLKRRVGARWAGP